MRASRSSTTNQNSYHQLRPHLLHARARSLSLADLQYSTAWRRWWRDRRIACLRLVVVICVDCVDVLSVDEIEVDSEVDVELVDQVGVDSSGESSATPSDDHEATIQTSTTNERNQTRKVLNRLIVVVRVCTR